MMFPPRCIKTSPYPTSQGWCSFRVQDDALVLPTPDVLEGGAEVTLAVLDRGRVLLVASKVGVDELNETVEILGSDLKTRVRTELLQKRNG